MSRWFYGDQHGIRCWGPTALTRRGTLIHELGLAVVEAMNVENAKRTT
jgi:hypothetical protein